MYPPLVHLDDDHELHVRGIEALKFATLIPRTDSDVHLRGVVRKVTAEAAVAQSLIDMVAALETGPDPYVLDRGNEQMRRWLSRIVGFEFEIRETVGRFKLSQDKDDIDREQARQRLVQQSRPGREPLIDLALGGQRAEVGEDT